MTRLGLFALVVLVFVAASASPSRARSLLASGASARVRGTIVFFSQRDPAGSLYAESAAGGPLRLILPGTNAESDLRGAIFLGPVVWSPDGKHFLYDLLEMPGAGGRVEDQTWISDLSGHERRLLAADTDWPPSWSPDGRRVAFESGHGSDAGIWVADVGGGERRLTTGDADHRPVWSPDGRWIAFLGAGSGPAVGVPGYALMVVSAHGGRPRPLVCCVEDAQPAWSPNGKRLAFLSHDVRPALYMTDLSGRLQLIDRAAFGPPAWSPSGKWLAVARGGPSTSAATAGTWIERPNGRARRRLSRLQPDDDYLGEPPAWSPDSRALAIASRPLGSPDIWVLPLSGHPYAITQGGRLGYQNFEPSWQPKNLPPTGLGGIDVSPGIPTDTTVADNVLRSTRRVQAIAADGTRVVIQYAHTNPDEEYRSIETWDAESGSVIRYSGGGGDYQGPAIAGDKLAYPGFFDGEYFLWTATLEQSAPRFGQAFCPPSSLCNDPVGDAVGKGALLVFDTWKAAQPSCHDPCSGPKRQSRLFRIMDGSELQIASSDGELTPLAVDGDRVLVNEGAGTLAILGSNGTELMKLTAPGMTEATLQGNDLVVHAGQALYDYDATSGALLRQWPLPADSTLTGAQDGTALLITNTNLELLQLGDGREATVTPPGDGPFHAQLEPDGLFYSYSVTDSQRPGRVAFIPRASLP